MLFIDRRERLFFFWPLIIAHRWETALMKYRVSTDYQQADGPPTWAFQDNIVLVPKNIGPKTKAFVAAEAERNPQLAAAGAASGRASRRRVLLANGLVHAHTSTGASLWQASGPDVFRRVLVRHHGNQ